jgi:K+-transporting ATPase KdpF subunit
MVVYPEAPLAAKAVDRPAPSMAAQALRSLYAFSSLSHRGFTQHGARPTADPAKKGNRMSVDIGLGLALAAGLFIYLLAALLAPERF